MEGAGRRSGTGGRGDGGVWPKTGALGWKLCMFTGFEGFLKYVATAARKPVCAFSSNRKPLLEASRQGRNVQVCVENYKIRPVLVLLGFLLFCK